MVPDQPPFPHFQGANDEKAKEAGNAGNKKAAGVKPPPKPPKEKVVKPKKEAIKAGKAAKPGPTAKAKVVGQQPAVVRGITYYKASRSDEEEQGEGESSTRAGRAPGHAPALELRSPRTRWSCCGVHRCSDIQWTRFSCLN